MSRRKLRQPPEALRPAVPGLLLPAAVRPLAGVLLAGCVAVTVFLGVRFTHQSHPGWLDGAVDARLQAILGNHRAVLIQIVRLGDPIPVTELVAALVLACAAARRWRGAVLLVIAVPAAAALTELLLKPLIDRTLGGGLSFPSGHATGIFALAAAIAVLLIDRPLMPAALRVLLALGAYGVAVAVAVALVSLGLHYFTDTVGGAAVGTGVVLTTAFILDRLGPWQQRRPVPVTSTASRAERTGRP